MGCRPAQKTSSGSAQLCAFLKEKLLVPVSDESADEYDVRFSNGAAMLTHSLSLSHFSCRACRALGIWRTAAGPPQARESATCDSSFTEKKLVMKPENLSGILKERLLHPVLVEPADNKRRATQRIHHRDHEDK